MNRIFASRNLQQHADFSDLLELLSIGLTNPGRDFACALVDGSYLSDLAACLNGLSAVLDAAALRNLLAELHACAQALSAQDCEALYHAINQEFTRLFVAPRKEQMPLYESLIVHRGDKKASMFINPTCMHCEQEYRKHGFPFPEKGKTPGDHVAIELRYLAFLISARINALTAQHDSKLDALDAHMLDFTKSHIQRWMHSFMDELAQVSAHPFYQLLARAGLTLEPVFYADDSSHS